MFEITRDEWNSLRCNISTSKKGGTRYMPYAFTEQGVSMLSSVLHSDQAISININIMRAFVFIRQYALTHKDLTAKLEELENKYDKQFSDIYEALNFLLQKEKQLTDQTKRKKIGFKAQNDID
jgi:hypothetical protein